MNAAEGSLARDFGERLRSLQELRESSKIAHAEFLDLANRIVEDLCEHEHQLSYWDHHVANADVGQQYLAFSKLDAQVQTIAQRERIVDAEQLRQLQQRLLQRQLLDGPAGAAIEAGYNAQHVAQQYGIDDPTVVHQLQWRSFCGPAGRAVMNGQDAQAAAQEYGITDPELTRELARFQ